MRVHDLVARAAHAAESDDPMGAVREMLETLRTDIDAIESALGYLSGTGGNARQVFYRSPNLTLLKVRFASGRRTPPHDHGTWATILVLSGSERNILYRAPDDALRKAGEVVLERGSILPMRAEAAHVVECLGEQPAIGLHVYGGDILELPRRVWDPETLAVHPLDPERYERLAQKATRMSAAPAP